MKDSNKTKTIKDFLSEIEFTEILEAANNGEYALNFDTYKAFTHVYDMFTKSTSEVVPDYKIIFMVSFPKRSKGIPDPVGFFCDLESLSSGRKYHINKNKVKDISDYANAEIGLVESTGKFGIPYAEQAVLLLLSFCALDKNLIDIFTKEGIELNSEKLINFSKMEYKMFNK